MTTPPKYPVVSYPKAGRTWLRYAGVQLDCALEFDHAGIYTQAEFIGHPWAGIPIEYRERPIAFLYRNPLDTAVSYFFQLMYKDVVPGRKTWRRAEDRGVPMPPVKINKCVLHPLYGIEAVCQYNRTWLDNIAPGSRTFQYEEFHADPETAFKDFFTWQGVVDREPTMWRDLADATSFEAMRKVQSSKIGHFYRLTQPRPNPESAKVRKGQVRGYTNYLGRGTIARAAKIAARYGFTI